MTITKHRSGPSLVIELEGRLDTVTAADLERELKGSLDGVTDLVFDCSRLDYLTSAGLRALLFAYKALRGKGEIRVTNVNEMVREVFEVTGFTGIMTVE